MNKDSSVVQVELIYERGTVNLQENKIDANNDVEFPMYKGRPLVRSGDTIYFGNMTDKFVIKIDIKSKKQVGDLEIADKVSIQLMYTDPIRARKAIVKTSEKKGLYLALDLADIWLTRALSE